MAPVRLLFVLTLFVLGGCPDAPGWDSFPLPGASAADTSSSTSFAPDEQYTTGGIMTTTVDPTSTSTTGEPEDTTTGTTGAPEPAIVEPVVLTPNPIESNGLISVLANTVHTDRVNMQLDNGEELELEMAAPGVFSGSIDAFTGLENGLHVALLTPWREFVSGETVAVNYTIALPDPGSQGVWETGDLIGPGQVAAMSVLPGGEVIEFGTLSTGNGPRCYLRRRDKGGVWFPSDVVDVLPGVECLAVDLVVDAQGVMFVLAERKVGNDVRWWLARIATWKAEPGQVSIGGKNEKAVALAAHPSGMIAACGFVPAPAPAFDDDAFAAIFRPNLPGEAHTFDYRPEGKPPHSFSERTRDCTFTGDTLALVGEANGLHGMEKDPRDRLFLLKVDTKAPTNVAWKVAPLGVKTQSGGQAVTVDGLGRLVIAGYVCDDVCQPEGELRIYDAEVDLVYLASLGVFPTKQFGVQDLSWSPAGYAVVATGGTMGDETAFTVRAYEPPKLEAAWMFTRKDGGVLHMAFALAIGQFGEVYAGGVGENGYPAVAYIGG